MWKNQTSAVRQSFRTKVFSFTLLFLFSPRCFSSDYLLTELKEGFQGGGKREQEMKGDRERLMSGIASRFIAFIIAVAAAAAAVNTYIISLYEQIFLFPFRLSCLLILCCRLLALFIRLELCTHVFISTYGCMGMHLVSDGSVQNDECTTHNEALWLQNHTHTHMDLVTTTNINQEL